MVARSLRLPSLVIVAAAAAFAGCAGTTQNVRAFRAYAHEDASMKVSIDRIEDINRTLELVDRILVNTPYTPGDIWVRRLPLRDADARKIKADLKESKPYSEGEFEVPILKVYRHWIEQVLDEYRAPPEKAKYPSLLDAVSSLVPRTAALKAHWIAFRDATAALGDATEAEAELASELSGKDDATKKQRDGELVAARAKIAAANARVEASKVDLAKDSELLAADATLTSGDRGQISRDAFGALSVAFRIELEALALMPIVVIQTIRSLPSAPRELIVKPSLKTVRQVWRLPMYLAGIKERMSRQIVILDGMTSVLAKSYGTTVDGSPGFAWRESVVDQIVGITLDSIRIDLKAGGEAFIFSSIPTSAQQSSDDGKTSIDYTGRKYKLEYRVQPIILASARLDLVLDWIRLPGVANLGFGYSTDRAFKSGGSIEQSSLTSQLGIKGAASDVIDFGLGLLGVRSSARIATFTAGEVRQVSATDPSQIQAKSPLRLTQTQVDVGYDILFALGEAPMRAWTEELVVGLRYMKYTLPRILYELKNTSTDPAKKTFTYDRESPPQNVDATYYMAGASARFGVGESPRFSPFADIALFGGAGPTSFYFLKDNALGDVASNRNYSKEAAFVFNGGAGLGIRWRLLPRGSRMRLDLRGVYRADFVYTSIQRSGSGDGAERKTDFGAIDVFHGPSVALRGAL